MMNVGRLQGFDVSFFGVVLFLSNKCFLQSYGMFSWMFSAVSNFRFSCKIQLKFLVTSRLKNVMLTENQSLRLEMVLEITFFLKAGPRHRMYYFSTFPSFHSLRDLFSFVLSYIYHSSFRSCLTRVCKNNVSRLRSHAW